MEQELNLHVDLVKAGRGDVYKVTINGREIGLEIAGLDYARDILQWFTPSLSDVCDAISKELCK